MISKYEKAINILYAVVFHSSEQEGDIPVISEVVYIGHTRKSFRNRMNGYQSGCGRAVNNRIHVAIKAHLETDGTVEVFVLPDRFGMKMQEIYLDVAAGLECSLIDHYCRLNHENKHRPLFNIAGNTCRKAAEEIEGADIAEKAEEFSGENTLYPEPQTLAPVKKFPSVGSAEGCAECQTLPCCFSFNLTGKTYWPKPVFNVPVGCDQHFGPHEDVVQVALSGRVPTNIRAQINRRTANINGTARLYFRGDNEEAYAAWKIREHHVGEEVKVDVIGMNEIRLS